MVAGIWTLGNRRQYRALGQRLALEGFVAAIVGYPTWPTAVASEQVTAVRAALQHAKASRHVATMGRDCECSLWWWWR